MKARAIFLSLAISLLPACKESFPPSEFEIGHVDFGSAYDLYIDSGYAYVTHNGGLSLVSLSDLSRPQETATVSCSEAAFGILVENDIAFLGSGGSKNLKIIDVSDKHNPEILSTLNIPGAIYGIAKNSNTLFLSNWDGNLIIVDISELNAPTIVSTLDCQGNGSDLAYHNQHIYYANPKKGLQVINVQDPSLPVMGSTVPSTGGAWDIHLHEGMIFLGRHNLGFTCLRIENDTTISRLFAKDNGGEVYGIFHDGNSLYSADLVNGLEVWEVSDSNQASLITTLQEYSPHDIVVKNDIVFLADQDRSFVILEIH